MRTITLILILICSLQGFGQHLDLRGNWNADKQVYVDPITGNALDIDALVELLERTYRDTMLYMGDSFILPDDIPYWWEKLDTNKWIQPSDRQKDLEGLEDGDSITLTYLDFTNLTCDTITWNVAPDTIPVLIQYCDTTGHWSMVAVVDTSIIMEAAHNLLYHPTKYENKRISDNNIYWMQGYLVQFPFGEPAEFLCKEKKRIHENIIVWDWRNR